jgi:hypothetical protein
MENYRSGKFTHPVKKIALDPYYAITPRYYIVYAERIS